MGSCGKDQPRGLAALPIELKKYLNQVPGKEQTVGIVTRERMDEEGWVLVEIT